MSKKDRIIVIVDRSGSMMSLADEATKGINRFIEEQKEVGRPADFQLVEFDDHIDIGEVQPMEDAKEYTLNPRGMTAMLDAIGKTLSARKSWPSKYGKNICMIVTDGNENASKEYTYATIGELIKKLEGKGWEFLFMASNIDANKAAKDIGILKGQTVALQANAAGTMDSYAAAANYMTNLRCATPEAAVAELDQDKARSSSIS